ncbi:Nif3-like dinuclear metal center hexameric protein [Salinimicrobium sp. MT39]|uniref:GTP cyclohydrolase 1 type 2 homolog n=1 Tax=Salinimicrobium profundisediminis TaxID=2994553 RepID=A0A9X3CU01_9FLAO|nr:Nif3-like dinuclear metal center hexameric protein [Salinimicrobium profundisediminis]MCX2836727.1 Nif3-like dinuclear metal center hexameric protein [Salinimicrobium profundisediminis]
MLVKEIIRELEKFAPTAYAEDFDNVGLLTGSPGSEVSGILVTLDTLETVVDEAIEKNCNLIVAFHPIIFSGLKKLTGSNYVERAILKAIKNDIAIYAIHTALDNSFKGVNDMICEQLGLIERTILIPQPGTIKKLVTFAPKKNAAEVREALFAAGAGTIGNYDHCSFNVAGSGSFRGNEASNPVIGRKGETHYEEEMQIGVTFPKHLEKNILNALFDNHPYEEVAYEVTTLENPNQHIGMGMTGILKEEMEEKAFLEQVKKTFGSGCIRHSALLGKPIKKVAVLGGSGSFAINQAIAAGADIFITADLKYHDFYKAEQRLVLADVGHYESEQYTKTLLTTYLKKKFANFAVVLSNTETNPIKYF